MAVRALVLLAAVAVMAAAQRPGPGSTSGTCGTGPEGAVLDLGCGASGPISAVLFAECVHPVALLLERRKSR